VVLALLLLEYQKKVLQYAGIEDVFTASKGSTKTMGNFVKATFDAVSKTYSYLTPDLWKKDTLKKTPYQEHTDFLFTTAKHKAAKREDE